MTTTTTYIEEHAHVCACCMILVANGDACHCDNGHADTLMTNLDGWWAYTGHSFDYDEAAECPECDAENGNYCDASDGEAGRWWTCEGCGDVPGMFATTSRITKLTRA